MYRLTDEIALVQTVDFFPPVVNDPYIYGQIAAANALSDVYAMGGAPKTVLNLVGYPDDQDPQLTWLGKILEGGAERCRAASAVIVGGHTVRDVEIKFGLAVTGLVHPKRFFTNATARPGDRLILTKPLGTGFVTTAHKFNQCPDRTFAAAVQSMVQLNSVGKAAVDQVGGVHAMTDITGFGLAGHSLEMAEGSKVTLLLNLGQLPLLPGVEQLAAKKNLRTRASRTNAEYVAPSLGVRGRIAPELLEVFYDAQTSGGLLISIEADRAEKLIDSLKMQGAAAAALIGEVVAREGDALVIQP